MQLEGVEHSTKLIIRPCLSYVWLTSDRFGLSWRLITNTQSQLLISSPVVSSLESLCGGGEGAINTFPFACLLRFHLCRTVKEMCAKIGSSATCNYWCL